MQEAPQSDVSHRRLRVESCLTLVCQRDHALYAAAMEGNDRKARLLIAAKASVHGYKDEVTSFSVVDSLPLTPSAVRRFLPERGCSRGSRDGCARPR